MKRYLDETESILQSWAALSQADDMRLRAWKGDFAPAIDHTVLRADAGRDAILQCCNEAREHGFASVCVNPLYVPLCAEALTGSTVAVCTVIGFPLGASTGEIKAAEARNTARNGAREFDMVMSVGRLKDGALQDVFDDIRAVFTAAREETEHGLIKVIIETCLLTDREKVLACLLARDAGADYVKTSTGFSTGGATSRDVRLMKLAVGEAARVKASGGIRTRPEAINMLEHGADRLGTSAGITLITP